MRTTFLLFVFIAVQFCSFGQCQNWYPFRDTSGQWSFLNKEGDRLNDAYFDSLVPFNDWDSLTFVQRNNKWGCLNKAGEYVVPIRYDGATFWGYEYNRKNFLLLEEIDAFGNKLQGIYSRAGKEVLPVQYTHIKALITELRYGKRLYSIAARLLDTSSLNNMGLYDHKGDMILPHAYFDMSIMPGNFPNVFEDQALLVLKHKENGYLEHGAYNSTKRFWLYPCSYSYYTYDKINSLGDLDNSGYSWYTRAFENRSNLKLIYNGPYLTVLKNTFELAYDYYDIEGSILAKSDDYTIDLKSDSGYYLDLVNDTLMRSEQYSVVEKLDGYSDYFLLRFGDKEALYSQEKGFIIGPTENDLFFDPSFPYFVLFQDRKSGSFGKYGIDGRVISKEEGLESNNKRLNGSLIICDSMGIPIDMKGYYVIKKLQLHPSIGEGYLVRKNKKMGVLSAQKEVLVPLKYDGVYKPGELLVLEKNGRVKLLNEELEKIVSYKKDIWYDMGYYQFVYKEGLLKSRVFDIVNNKYIIEGVQKPNPRMKDSIVSSGLNLTGAYRFNDSTWYFQLLTDTLWTIYDLEGEKIAESPVKSHAPLQLVQNYDSIIGYYYYYPWAQSIQEGSWYGDYVFFDGLRLEGLDSLNYLSYYPNYKLFFTSDIKGNNYVYNWNGALRIKYRGEKIRAGKYDRVLTEHGYTLIDSRHYNQVINVFYDEIYSHGSIYFARDGGQWYFFKDDEVPLPIPTYDNYGALGGTHVIGRYRNSNLVDIYNGAGKLIISKAKFINPFGPLTGQNFLLLRNIDGEYWFTNDGFLYGKNALN